MLDQRERAENLYRQGKAAIKSDSLIEAKCLLEEAASLGHQEAKKLLLSMQQGSCKN